MLVFLVVNRKGCDRHLAVADPLEPDDPSRVVCRWCGAIGLEIEDSDLSHIELSRIAEVCRRFGEVTVTPDAVQN